MIHLVEEARHARGAQKITAQLRKLDLIDGNSGAARAGINGPGLHPDDLFKGATPAERTAARAGVVKHLKSSDKPDNAILRSFEKGNQRLKGIFLAVPLPHVWNLVNLSYNKYGMATTLRGLQFAAQEATGVRRTHLNELVDRLQKAGSDNQYSKLFSEVNPIAPIRQVQRFANKAQDKVLNPVERGLRAAMLEVEEKAGKTGVDAARNIHKALGTDAPTGVTQVLNYLPLSQFPRFHTQTALGSGLRTLVDKPGRITGFEHVAGGPTQKKDGQAHYHLSTPTASTLKFLDNPLGYVTGPSTLGELAGAASPFSPVGLLNKARSEDAKGQHKAAQRDYLKAIQAMGGKVLPLSGAGAAASEIAGGKRGDMHQTGAQDALSSIAGGYWSKR